jgi:hypothetical protein
MTLDVVLWEMGQLRTREANLELLNAPMGDGWRRRALARGGVHAAMLFE